MKVFLSIFLISCMTSQNSSFYDKILSDFRDGSYYLSLDLKSSNFTGKVIIENAEFYYYLNQKEGIAKDSYQEYAKKILQSHESLDIQNADLERWSFNKVPLVNSVTKSAKNGADEFIKTYFEGRVLKDGITDDERTAIINQLFEWEIVSNIDDETGYLVISR